MSDYPGLYIHVPFCLTKCPYCDFYSVTDRSMVSRWLDAIEREGKRMKGLFSSFNTLYIGGGTPTVLKDREMVRLISLLSGLFRFEPDSEKTIEVNPDDITRERAESLRELGFNRVSIGVQSFNDLELRFLQRRHTAAQAESAVAHFLKAGFSRINLDLMYGLPGQTDSDWIKSLERALSFKPAHLSCYQLTIAEQTPFGNMAAHGRIIPLIEEQERDFFMITSEYLSQRGYIHYEVSNYAKGNENRSRHNMKYWRRTPTLGLGPAAHSFYKEKRWWNVRSLTEYCRLLSGNKSPIKESERLSPDQARLEGLALGLRTREGIPLFWVEECKGGMDTLCNLVESGLLVRQGDRVIPTREGLVVADTLPLLLLSC